MPKVSFLALPRTHTDGHEPTLGTGSFPASLLIKVAAEAIASWFPELGPTQVGTQTQAAP
jgi:hypothetical protein